VRAHNAACLGFVGVARFAANSLTMCVIGGAFLAKPILVQSEWNLFPAQAFR
jgi:aspartate oxidase